MISKGLKRYFKDFRKGLVLTATQRQQYIYEPDRHFTRKRVLHFSRTVSLVLSLLKKAWPLSYSIFSVNFN